MPCPHNSQAGGSSEQLQEQGAKVNSHQVSAWHFKGSPVVQVSETRGTHSVPAAAGSGSRADPRQRGREQMCFYGAVRPRLHDARGCSISPSCTRSQVFCVTDSGCYVVFSASNSHDGLKIDYCTVMNLNATLLVFILLIY